jgi:uncharacterized protein with ParB-like and HNH nuclease domain
MKTGRYSLKDLFTHNEIEQIIIPEIQRDYVWQTDNVEQLLNAVYKNFSEKKNEKLELLIENELITEKSVNEYLQKEYEKLKYNFKIGFIYAYHDNEYAGKFFLIDGQQRITTLYLLLFALYRKTDKRNNFNELYFKNNKLKLDYKVREASHDFLQEFISYDGNVENSPKYYKKEYEKDISIINIIKNYKAIYKFIEEKDVNDEFIDYVENFIEFNYFDTNISEQGEQLYLYMNSRGEHLSYQELIRAEIIKKEKIIPKKEAGALWEDWQNYFWVNRGKDDLNANADKGFEEFLKWATVIHIFTQDNPNIETLPLKDRIQTKSEGIQNYIHRASGRLQHQKKLLHNYQINEIDFSFLKKIFDALKYLFEIKTEYVPIEEKWLSNNELAAINYVYFIPLLYYISEKKDNIELRDIERLAMFLKNITYSTTNAKTPDTTVVNVMQLVKALVQDNQKDITYFINEKFEGKYKSVLTNFEKFKLEKLSTIDEREKLEEFIWNVSNDIEFSDFTEGNISFVFDYLNKPETASDNIDVERMYILKDIFKATFFNFKNDNIFRRALLTFGDYSLSDGGGSGHIDGWKERYTFCIDLKPDKKEWERLLNHNKQEQQVVVFGFVKSIEKNYKLDFSYIDFFNKCIEEHSDTDWKEPFIKYPELLKYSEKKRFLWNDDEHNIILLNKLMANNAVFIQTLLISIIIEKWKFKVLGTRSCYFDFYYDKASNTIENDTKEDGYYLQIRYNAIDSQFEYYINLNENSTKTFIAFDDTVWKKKEDYLVIDNNKFTEYNNEISILENIKNVNNDVIKIVKEIETILKND